METALRGGEKRETESSKSYTDFKPGRERIGRSYLHIMSSASHSVQAVSA